MNAYDMIAFSLIGIALVIFGEASATKYSGAAIAVAAMALGMWRFA